MKKKILVLCLVVALAVTAVVGGTLAYFTDTDAKTNTFTTGKVDITLNETFEEQTAKLLPGKDIAKIVNVTNNEEDAYVRLHIAFPADTIYYGANDGVQEYNNLVHFNQKYASLVAGEWNWTPTAAGATYDAAHPGYPGNGTNYNTYTTTIGGVEYRVFVVTYMTKLTEGATTKTDAMFNVYLDKYADTTDGVTYTAPANKDAGGYRTAAMSSNLNNYKILIVSEGCQAEGFNDPYTALNTSFGVPSSTNNPWA